MAWNKDKPAGGDKIRLSDDYIRANNEALENAFSEGHEFSTGGNQTGKHTTPTFVDNGADPAQPTATNEVKLYNNAGILYTLNQAGTKHNLNPTIPAGTKMLFKQSSAPAGWTFRSEDNDRALINTSTEADGGSIGGGWTISGVSVDNHTLTIAEIPSHTHRWGSPGVKSGSDQSTPVFGGGTTWATSSTGGDGAHNHGLTADGTWRPAYTKVITCQKD